MDVKLGFDLNCFCNRYPEPEAWTDFVASCGVRVVQFSFDILDFLLPTAIQRKLVDRTLRCCEKSGIRIKCAFGGHNHHQNYLGHPDPEVAAFYETFYKRMADLTAMLGAEGFGTCFAINTVRTERDHELRRSIFRRALDAYLRLAEYGARCGLQYLLYEMTSVPRETAATFQENDEILAELRNAAIPMKLCLDVGHRNQESAGQPEADPYCWIRRYASVSPVIHIHQSDQAASRHWPFTEQTIRQGDVFPDKVLSAIRDSQAEQEILLALEVRHSAFFPDEYRLESDLRESVRFWREYVPQ